MDKEEGVLKGVSRKSTRVIAIRQKAPRRRTRFRTGKRVKAHQFCEPIVAVPFRLFGSALKSSDEKMKRILFALIIVFHTGVRQSMLAFILLKAGPRQAPLSG